MFDIKHFAIHDGPGIRTTVFLKGCPLKCEWCHSPESQSFEKEIMANPELCISCGACVKTCTSGALKKPGFINYESCNMCFKCVDECYSGALEAVGHYMTVDEVLREVEKDRLLYETSKGGVTISGGEPTAQPKFLLPLLNTLKENDFHTVLDTCGYVPWGLLKSITPEVDLFLYDLKHMDSDIHKKMTGKENDLVLSNLEKLDRESASAIRIRVPLIPGINDSERNLTEMAEFLGGLNRIEAVDLLPYHRIGIPKYQALGRDYKLNQIRQYEVGRLIEIQQFLLGLGLKVVLEGV